MIETKEKNETNELMQVDQDGVALLLGFTTTEDADIAKIYYINNKENRGVKMLLNELKMPTSKTSQDQLEINLEQAKAWFIDAVEIITE